MIARYASGLWKLLNKREAKTNNKIKLEIAALSIREFILKLKLFILNLDITQNGKGFHFKYISMPFIMRFVIEA